MTRIHWARGTRPGWSAFHHTLIGVVQVGAGTDGQTHRVTTYSEPSRGRIVAGHVVVDGELDLRIKPGQTLVVPDPLDPSTWWVGNGGDR